MDHRLKKIALFSLPVSANNLINILGNIIGVILVAQLGIKEIAAVNISTSLYIVLLTITSTCTYATSILTGIEVAKAESGQDSSHARVFQSSIIAIILFSLPIAVIMWHGSNLLELAGQPGTLTQLTVPYFHFASLAIFAINLGMVNSQFCIGLKKPKISLYFSLLRLLLISILSYGLILGHMGLPKLGIAGIPASAFYAQSIVCLLMYAYFMVSLDFKRLNLFKHFKQLTLSSLIRFYKLGVPIGVQFGGELAAIFVNTMMIGYFGTDALAASQVSIQYGLLLIMIFLGLSQTLSVFTSINYQENQVQTIKKDCLAAVKLHSILFLGLGVLFAIAYRPLISLYFDVNLVENYYLLNLTLIITAIRWFILYFDGLRSLFAGVLRGLGHSAYPMKIGLFCLWFISNLCSYLIGFVLNGGIIGLCIGFSSGFVVASLLLWLRLNSLLKTESENINAEFVKQP
ncbi:MATE family efflux transporter [Legionella quinlivanii]|uniref:MATE family efflux transporter n=1 Tax=Legionella quinlivanii TaxID=45073 RepID=UPI002244A941|nr:MATE family efflux transporter [Legionella quinlivanii]MCW8449917.1 MATE family efflux transporter [Legionella quinlivanii]